jgi:DNA-directed RNA polymerase subunit RPC12/RpoP
LPTPSLLAGWPTDEPEERRREMAVYKCKTCGAVAPEAGHLCDPTQAGNIYTCEYCGAQSAKKKHICKPKLTKVKYFCEACGRVAVKEDEVCKPKAL